MMQKSKFPIVCVDHYQANAAWDDFENQPCISNMIHWSRTESRTENPLSEQRVSTFARTLLRHNNHEPTANTASSHRPEISSVSKRPRSSALIEPEQLEELLRALRSNKFAGKIDLEHHSHYFEPPRSEARLQQHTLGAAPQHYVSLTQLTAARKNYFQQALPTTPSKYSRSHGAFGGTESATSSTL